MRIHIVRPGDTLWKLSRHYNVPLQTLIDANPQIKDPNKLEAGMKIRIPTGGVPVKPPEKPKKPRFDSPEYERSSEMHQSPESLSESHDSESSSSSYRGESGWSPSYSSHMPPGAYAPYAPMYWEPPMYGWHYPAMPDWMMGMYAPYGVPSPMMDGYGMYHPYYMYPHPPVRPYDRDGWGGPWYGRDSSSSY